MDQRGLKHLLAFLVLQETAMHRLLAYMKRLGIRPVELLRGFDKSVQFDITKDEFIKRLKVNTRS